MANIKITDLTAYTDAASTDVLPIVDVGADVTKKIAISDIVKAVPQGTAALPGLAFDGDPNTGIYSPGADQVAISTNGAGRLFIDSSGNIGVGTTAVSNLLHLRSDSSSNVDHLYIQNRNGGANSGARIAFSNGTVDYGDNRYAYIGAINTGAFESGNHLVFATNANGASPSEKARITNGQLLVGTSSARTSALHTGSLQLEGTTFSASTFLIISNANDSSGSYIHLGKARGGSIGSTTVVANGDTLGQIHFTGSDGTNLINGAIIAAHVDGTPGANSMPSSIVLSTTASGASSPTEAMRIKNTRVINFSNAPVYADNAAAKTGGLVDGDVYRTSTGDLKIVYT